MICDPITKNADYVSKTDGGVAWKAFAGLVHKKCAQLVGLVVFMWWRRLYVGVHPMGQRGRVALRVLRDKVKKMEHERWKPAVQFEEQEDGKTLEEDGKMEVDEETESRKQLEIRKRRQKGCQNMKRCGRCLNNCRDWKI